MDAYQNEPYKYTCEVSHAYIGTVTVTLSPYNLAPPWKNALTL